MAPAASSASAPAAALASAARALPKDWTEATDPSTGKVHYVNHRRVPLAAAPPPPCQRPKSATTRHPTCRRAANSPARSQDARALRDATAAAAVAGCPLPQRAHQAYHARVLRKDDLPQGQVRARAGRRAHHDPPMRSAALRRARALAAPDTPRRPPSARCRSRSRGRSRCTRRRARRSSTSLLTSPAALPTARRTSPSRGLGAPPRPRAPHRART